MSRIVLLLLSILLPATVAFGSGSPQLTGMTVEEVTGQTRLRLDFSALPGYRLESSGQRVDLILPGVTVSPVWRGRPEQGRVISVLLAQRQNELVVSFLLRQPPQRVMAAAENPSRLTLDLFWESPPTRAAIAFQIPGVPTAAAGQGSSTLALRSAYGGDWRRFIRDYQTPFRLPAPLVYSPPQLPEGADPGEVESYRQGLSLAVAGHQHRARMLVRDAFPGVAADSSLKLPVRLLKAELALAAGAWGEAALLLEAESAWPASLEVLRRLRLASALAKSRQLERARQLWRELGPPPWPLSDPFTLASAGEAFAVAGEGHLAASLYGLLEEELTDPAAKGLARFARVEALAREGEPGQAVEAFKQIHEAFAGGEVGDRAWLKLLDHGVLVKGERDYPAALAGYGAVASGSSHRGLREEAAFKLALVMAWSGQKERSVQQLHEFLRQFQGGVLRGEAEVLMAELLPQVIRQLVARGDDLPAAVLVEENRKLLLQGAGWDFLSELADAFARLGLPERSVRIYLFMLESRRAEGDKEPLYLPLVRLLTAQADSLRAGEFSRHYLERHPRGKDRPVILLLALRALRQDGRLAEAASLLQEAGGPVDSATELEAARLLQAQQDYRQLAKMAGRPQGSWPVLPETLLLQAEALRETGAAPSALPLYHRLVEEEAFADQAAFRLAQIRLSLGERGEALKILRRLAEEGKDPLWRRLAKETLDLAAAT